MNEPDKFDIVVPFNWDEPLTIPAGIEEMLEYIIWDEPEITSLPPANKTGNSLPLGPAIHLSFVVSHNIEPVAVFPPAASLTYIPPFVVSVPFNTIILSPMFIFVESIVVVVPFTTKSPPTVKPVVVISEPVIATLFPNWIVFPPEDVILLPSCTCNVPLTDITPVVGSKTISPPPDDANVRFPSAVCNVIVSAEVSNNFKDCPVSVVNCNSFAVDERIGVPFIYNEPVEIYKCLHCLEGEPKSNVLVIEGIIDELKFAVIDTVSDVLSPIVILPPNVKLPSIFAFPVMSNDEPEIPANEPWLPVPDEPNVMSPVWPPICNVPKSVFTYGSPNANEPDFCAVVPRLNLSPILVYSFF